MIRRKFVKAAIVATTSLISLPVLGKNACTVSGIQSGNVSQSTQDVCQTYDGIPVSEYGQELLLLGHLDMLENIGEIIPGYDRKLLDLFMQVAPTPDEDLLMETISAYFNARRYNFPYTPSEVVELFNTYNVTKPGLLKEVFYKLNNVRMGY